MRSNLFCICVVNAMTLLMGSAFADSMEDVFAANRDLVLSQKVTTAAGWVFTVGKAKSSRKAGEDIGYSKAAMLAYGNIEVLNYSKAEWPDDISDDEKKIVWRRYRAQNPAKYTLEGSTRVHREHPDAENFLVVLAFPEGAVKTEAVTRDALAPILMTYRDEVAKTMAVVKARGNDVADEVSDQREVAIVPTKPDNRPTIAITYDDLAEALMGCAVDKPAQGVSGSAPVKTPNDSNASGYSESGGIKINNTMDESLML